MLNLLSPIWLFAVAAVVIPVVIHLWNIRPGKVLKVGSTSLIAQASRRSSRSIKLLDIPLLLLRCLLLILLALLLALPIWQKIVQSAKAKGWVLLPKESFSKTYQHYQKSIDSLSRSGYEFHYFNYGFPKADLRKILVETKNLKAIDSTLQEPQQYWNLLKQLDTKVASDMPVQLFTPNTISHFAGEKPAVALNISWKTFTPVDSVSTWIQDARLTNNNTIKIIKGTGTPSGISYNYIDVNTGGNADINVSAINGRPVVKLAADRSHVIPVDTSVLRIAIYTDRYTADAGYLKAALDAVAQYTQRKMVIRQYNNVTAMPTDQNWVFWLSDQPWYARLLRPGVNIFAYQQGKQVPSTSWLTANTPYALPNGSEQIQLLKTISPNRDHGRIIWQDGFGNPLLSAEQQGQVKAYRFYTHFNPTWNDLVWNSSFPKLLLQVLNNPGPPIPLVYDKRSLSAEQVAPVKITVQHAPEGRFTVQKELGIYLWLALTLVFLCERWLATRNKTMQTNG